MRAHEVTRSNVPTFYDAKAQAWGLPRRRLARVERRLRRRKDRLDAAGMTRWYASRAVLRERGIAVPPVTRGLP